MEDKKHPKQDHKNKRFDFFLLGLALSLLFVFGAFSYTQYDEEDSFLEDVEYEDETVIIEMTVQKRDIPPPPPELVVVDDNTELDEEEPQLQIYEFDEETAIPDFDPFEEEPEAVEEVFTIFNVQDPPKFLGEKVETAFPRYLRENMNYPTPAREAEREGVVTVSFIVDKNGNVTNVKVISNELGFGLEEEAIRIIKSTSGKWTPARQRDKAVSMTYQLPIRFKLY